MTRSTRSRRRPTTGKATGGKAGATPPRPRQITCKTPALPQEMFGADGVDAMACPVRFELLHGQAVAALQTMPTYWVDERRVGRKTVVRPSFMGGMAKLCRGAVGGSYIAKLLGKHPESRFAIAATLHKRDVPQWWYTLGEGVPPGERDLVPERVLVGYAVCSLHNSYAGVGSGGRPVTGQRICMLDLVCTSERCPGMGKAMMRALLKVARQVYHATLFVLEATDTSSTFYHQFGFRRVPNACAGMGPDHPEVQEARRAFAAASWKDSKRLRECAGIDQAYGPVYWKAFNRPGRNGTIIMSRCLGPPPSAAPPAVDWQSRTPAELLARDIRANHARVLRQGRTQLSAPMYGRYAQELAAKAAARAAALGVTA